MLYTYRYRLYPTPNQELLCKKHFGCSRFVYNYFLHQRASTYENYANQLPKLKETYEWLKEVGSQSLQYALKCLHRAYNNFFIGLARYPHPKRKCRRDSFRVAQNVKVMNSKLVIPKFLEGININLHRKLYGKIKFATVSKDMAERYHVSITVDKDIVKLPKNDKVIGLDLNVKDIVDDAGNKYINPCPMKAHENRLRLTHQKITRKVKGSNGRKKACKALARKYQKIRNIREDHLHKLSKRIIDENQVICVEDLSVKDMVKKVSTEKMPRWEQKRLHKSVLDCGFFSFVRKLTYKALWYGRTLLKCSRWFPSSQLCNTCNYQNKDLKPHEREWACWNCWRINDRDINSACNVKEDCLRTAGNAGIAVRPTVSLGLCLSG